MKGSAKLLPSLQELLTSAGFALQRGNRATCAYCSGGDRSTVTFNEEWARCFRCGWKSSYIALARELGFFNKILSKEDRAEIATFAAKEKRRAEFNSWRNSKLENLIESFRSLNFRAKLAREVLEKFPEEELAWQALANLYNNEAGLFAAFDFFSLETVSRWLEQTAAPQELIELWSDEQKR